MSQPTSAFSHLAFRAAVYVVIVLGIAVAAFDVIPVVLRGNPQYDAIVRAHAHRGLR